ncbi:Spermidine N(1)-acetyltransferase [Rickettsiales bacterium Ac37b]|nr:Spermidine N(1)-acetyltransferase [Rickettsiales bacterium Ac37b]
MFDNKVFKNFPIMDLGDIILRDIVVSQDSRHFLEYISDSLVNKYLSDDELPRSLREAEVELNYWKDLFRHKRSIYWAIAKKKNNTLIGTCGFNSINYTHARAEVSYDLCRKEWGQGIMTRVVQAVCDFAFTSLNINRVQATVAHDNIASIKVLTKLGFQREGDLRQYGILHGQKKDFYMYGLLSSDLVF